MLELQHLTKSYRIGTADQTDVLKDFNLTVPGGQFVSIIGSNGSGKTSLLNLICGSISAEDGCILIDGKDINHWPEYIRSRRIGRVYQDPAKGTAASLSVLENLSIAANKGKAYNLGRAVSKKDSDYFRSLLEPLGMNLENRLQQSCGSLSGGQRQVLALLMSTMTRPDILILDEHTAALDPKSSESVMNLTDKLVSDGQFTVLMVTHNLRFALQYGNRLLMMHEGQILLDKSDAEKNALLLQDVLDRFNSISIERGN